MDYYFTKVNFGFIWKLTIIFSRKILLAILLSEFCGLIK